MIYGDIEINPKEGWVRIGEVIVIDDLEQTRAFIKGFKLGNQHRSREIKKALNLE